MSVLPPGCPSLTSDNGPKAGLSSSRHLKFGVERILSDEVKPKRGAGSVVVPVALPAFLPPASYLQPHSFLTHGAYQSDVASTERHTTSYSAAAFRSPFHLAHYSAVFSSLGGLLTSPLSMALATSGDSQRSGLVPSPPNSPQGEAAKRKRSWSRAVFSNLQRKGLEKRFGIQKYITKPDRRQLAATLGLTDAQVKVWFQNRRMKWRHSKEGREEIQARAASGSGSFPAGCPAPTDSNPSLPSIQPPDHLKSNKILYQTKNEPFHTLKQQQYSAIHQVNPIGILRQ